MSGCHTESEADLSSGDFSEPCTPFKKPTSSTSAKSSNISHQQREINRKYHELQQQISLEFQLKQREWERIRNASLAAGGHSSSGGGCQSDDYSAGHNGKELAKISLSSMSAKPIEENLTADFKKKLAEWRVKVNIENCGLLDNCHSIINISSSSRNNTLNPTAR